MKKILIVDDERHVLRVMEQGLRRAGFDVATAFHGLAALEAMRIELPDALLLDLNMPKMDGRTLCTQIEKEFPARHFPIVIATSSTEAEHRAWTKEVKDLLFTEKPLSIRKLLAALSPYLDAQPSLQEHTS